MKVAILYICTGIYNLFFNDFYTSAKKYFLTKAEKTFFVWTDKDDLANGLSDVIVFHKECEGFPADSLFRFEMFMQAEVRLLEFDYIYFFNANAEFKQPVDEEILPDETGLAMGIWRGKRENQHPMFYPYERNKQSKAYIPPYGKHYVYYMGGLNGGTSKAYLEMIRTLSVNIRDDFNRGIIAIYHDESHINAYMRTHRCKVLSALLNCPEESPNSSQAKVVLREKTKIDPYFNKGRKVSLSAKVCKGMKIIWHAIRWYAFI